MRIPPVPQQPDPVSRLQKQMPAPVIPIALLPHCEAVPLGVLARILLERILDETALLELLEQYAPQQYTRSLTLHALIGLLIQVSIGSRKSVYAAYKADHALAAPTITTVPQAVYQKLGRMEPALSEAIVRFSFEKLQLLVKLLPAAALPVLAGYRTRILDGNVLTKTEHRLKPLRSKANGCLPGKSVVVYDADSGLVSDVVVAEDSYAQERVLARDLLPRVQPGDLWIADRHFCTAPFAFGVSRRGGSFVVRQHQSNLPAEALDELRSCGRTETGAVFEQRVRVYDAASGASMELRRIEVRLFEDTREGERVLGLLTNLPAEVAATTIADVYRKRWKIETLFQFMTDALHGEVPSLGQPRAALFAFVMAVVAANALATVRGTLRAAHGVEAETAVSGHYLADEIGADYRALMKYVTADQWAAWRAMPVTDLARLLPEIARHVNLRALRRHSRGPKKKAPKRVHDRRHSHYSTYRLLKEDEESC